METCCQNLCCYSSEAKDFREREREREERTGLDWRTEREKKKELGRQEMKEAEAARQHRRTKQQLCFLKVYCNHDRPRKSVVRRSREDATDPRPRNNWRTRHARRKMNLRSFILKTENRSDQSPREGIKTFKKILLRQTHRILKHHIAL